MTLAVRTFAKKLNRTNNKAVMRNKVLNTLLDLMKSDKKSYGIVTLPSSPWLFEQDLMKELKNIPKNERKRLNIWAFEQDWKIYCDAVIKMPKDKSAIYSVTTSKHVKDTYQMVKTTCKGNSVSIHHTNVLDFLSSYKKSFDFMWLDFTCNALSIKDKISFAEQRLNNDGILVITLVKGRERYNIGDRVNFMNKQFSFLELVQYEEYFDTCQMMQLTFRKDKKTLN